jgi:hypothetical protein
MPRRKQSIANKIKARDPLRLKEDKALLGIHYKERDLYEQILAMQAVGMRTDKEIKLKDELKEKIEDAVIESETEVIRLIADLIEIADQGARSPLEYALIQLIKGNQIPKRKHLSAYDLALKMKPILGFLPSTRQVVSAGNRIGLKTTGVRGKGVKRRPVK